MPPSFGVELSPVDVRDAGEIERAVMAFARSTSNGGLIVTASALATWGAIGVGASVVCTWAVAFDFTNEAVDQRAPPRSAAKASVEAAVSVSKICVA